MEDTDNELSNYKWLCRTRFLITNYGNRPWQKYSIICSNWRRCGPYGRATAISNRWSSDKDDQNNVVGMSLLYWLAKRLVDCRLNFSIMDDRPRLGWLDNDCLFKSFNHSVVRATKDHSSIDPKIDSSTNDSSLTNSNIEINSIIFHNLIYSNENKSILLITHHTLMWNIHMRYFTSCSSSHWISKMVYYNIATYNDSCAVNVIVLVISRWQFKSEPYI